MKQYRHAPWTDAFRRLALFAATFITIATHAQSGPGNALLIAGDINYVSVPHSTAFNSLPITVTAWVKTSTTTGLQGLVNKYVDSSVNGWTLNLRDGRVRA